MLSTYILDDSIESPTLILTADHSTLLPSFFLFCEAAQISMCWAPNGLNELPEVRSAFRLSLHFDWQIDDGIFFIIARTQILVHSWEPGTRIPALFRRWT